MAGHREQAMAVKQAVTAAIERAVAGLGLAAVRVLDHDVVGQGHHPHGTAGRIAGWMMAHRPSNCQRNRWVVSLLEVQPTDRVLEIGFGPGLAIAELSRRVGDQGHVDGIDHSQVMLHQATSRNAAAIAAGRVSLHRASVDQLPPALDGPFDAILAVNSLGFWPAPTERLHQLHRRLRPGGRIAIAAQPRCPGATASTSRNAAHQIEALLQDAGYTTTRTETLDLDPPVVCILAVNPDPPTTAACQRQTPRLEAGAVKETPQARDRTPAPEHPILQD
jgi:SAM-dependent methyltransferase